MGISAQVLADSIPNVTVKGHRTTVKVTTATPVQQLSKESFTALGIGNVGDAVKHFAGVSVRDYGGVGGMKTVSVRSMGAAHTLVSYDGVAVSNCQAGQVDVGRFSLDNVSMLSLSVGQNTDLLQPAKLLTAAGVLNIETERPDLDRASGNCKWEVLARGGSFGLAEGMTRTWWQMGGRTMLANQIRFSRADGRYPFEIDNGKLSETQRRMNSDVKDWNGEQNLYCPLGNGGELHVKAYEYLTRRGLPGAVVLYNPMSDERMKEGNVFVQAKYKQTLSDKWAVSGRAKYNYGYSGYRDKGSMYENGTYATNHHQNEYYVSATVSYNPCQGLKLALAQDGTLNHLHSDMPDCPFPTRLTSQSALTAQYKRGAWNLSGTLSATFTHEHTVSTEATPDNFRKLSPTVQLSVQPFGEELMFVRLMYKNTFRLPTFNDLYYYRLGNRSLKPECADEWNVGLTWNKDFDGFIRQATLSADGFHNKVDDKIVAFPSTYAWRMMNFGHVSITGLDLSASMSADLGEKARMNLSGNYSLQKAIDVTDTEAKNYRHQLPYTPRHSWNIAASLNTPVVNVGYSAIGMGKRYFLQQNTDENLMPAYVEHTVSAWHTFALGHTMLDLKVEATNITNKQYEIIKNYPMPGRAFRITGTFNF
ncbi:MAG: TonB-dependent receptor [Bacteroidales bacterium]|nr:TonB-dependent receptor [Bacteroidales bacterium]